MPDETASYSVNSDNPDFDADINPGNEIRAFLVYDIPKTDSIARLNLHESDSSRGVSVTVR